MGNNKDKMQGLQKGFASAGGTEDPLVKGIMGGLQRMGIMDSEEEAKKKQRIKELAK